MDVPLSFTIKSPALHKYVSASFLSKSSKFLILQFLVKCYKLHSVFKILSKSPPTHKSHESLIIWSCEITLQIKKQYLEYQIVYCHQTWQDIYLPWWGSTHEVTWPFYYVSCKITWQIKTIFSTILPMTTKLCNMGSS